MICYITSLICKDFLLGPKKNVAFKVLSGPITIVFFVFCQRRSGVATARISRRVLCVLHLFLILWRWDKSSNPPREVYVLFSRTIDLSSRNVARLPITSLTFWLIHLLHRLLEPHVRSWCFLFVTASNYFMRGVTDFGADSFSCDPVSCLVFLPFSSPAPNYLLLLLPLQKFFFFLEKYALRLLNLCDTWIIFSGLFRVNQLVLTQNALNWLQLCALGPTTIVSLVSLVWSN